MSVMVNDPLRVPTAVGVMVTLTVHPPSAGTLDPQVFVSAKSPLAAMPVIVSAAFPALVSVTVWALEVLPTS